MKSTQVGRCFVCGQPWRAPDATLIGCAVHRACWEREGDQRTRDILAERIGIGPRVMEQR